MPFLSTQIAKKGGPDPNLNKALANVIKEAQNYNVPKYNIERSIKKAFDTSAEDYKAGVFEVYGFAGASIIVASLSDNTNRASKAIKAVAKKADVKMASSGSVLFSFEHKVNQILF